MAHPLLENDHNVYVLGAGFSVGAGLPVVRDFLGQTRDALDWLSGTPRTTEYQAIERVLSFRHDVAGAAYRTVVDVDNVEELFSLASADDASGMHSDMCHAIAATLDYCRSIAPQAPTADVVLAAGSPLRQTLPQPQWAIRSGSQFGYATGYDAVRAPVYQILLGALTGQLSAARAARRTTFISFNYDLVVEEALQQCGLQVDYGIPAGGLTSLAPWTSSGAGVRLLKLHGSVNWALPGLQGHRMTAFPDYANVVKLGLVPVLVPPTWRKEFTGQLANVWDSAVAALRTATRVTVIGFSMPLTDQHFRYLLAAGLRQNISLRQIVFIDPSVDAVRMRALEVLRPELEGKRTLRFESAKAFQVLNKDWLDFLGRPLAADTTLGGL